MAVASVFLVFLACLGAGSAVLRLLRVASGQRGWEGVIWSFAVGFGSVGWLGFFVAATGMLSTHQLIVFCAVCSLGVVFLRPGSLAIEIGRPWTPTMCLLLLAAAIVVGFSAVQGMSPPTDADSLAYHFALPKQFIENGALEFVPRAVDGAVPLLIHMTYVIAYGLGGEMAMTLWTGVVSAMAAAFLYVVARRFLDAEWAFATVLLFVTAPAFIYGSVSGQVETKLTLFVIGAVFAMTEGLRTGRLRYIALAGLMAGCYAGAKYLGLFFVVACSVPLFFRQRWLTHGAVYGIAVIAAGSQWYLWNWVHTGDPVFPVLFNSLGIPDSEIWNSEQNAIFREFFYGSEAAVPIDPFWFVVYPFQATLAPMAEFESGRTGLGPFALLAMPFAAVGAWRNRSRIGASALWTVALVAFAFYVLWFVGGSSQRVRHLLPIYPLLLICLMTAARHSVRDARWALPLAGATALTLLIQLGGQMLFGLNFARFVFSDEDRDRFLIRTVFAYEPVPWINANLSGDDKILVLQRQLAYYIDFPVMLAHPLTFTAIELRMTTQDPPRFMGQLRAQGITHMLVPLRKAKTVSYWVGDLEKFARALVAADCAEIVSKFDVVVRPSRTISTNPVITYPVGILAITNPSCRL